jgi:prepilin-type N-terminal cleavage/methylation domain-containing protein
LNRASKGFTLIELLVVIFIIALVITMLLPSFANQRANERDLFCRSNLNQLAIETNVYGQMHNALPNAGFYPSVEERQQWDSHEAIWFCPELRGESNPRPYAYYPSNLIRGFTLRGLSEAQATKGVYIAYLNGQHQKLFVDPASLHRTNKRTSSPFAFNAVKFDGTAQNLRDMMLQGPY